MVILTTPAASSPADARRLMGESGEPTVVLIHGGGITSRAAVANKQAITDAGWRTIEVTYPFGDVAAAYRAVAAQLPKTRPVAFGESAGGTIALWLAAHRKVDRAISVGGPTDLTRWSPSSPTSPVALQPRAAAGRSRVDLPLDSRSRAPSVAGRARARRKCTYYAA